MIPRACRRLAEVDFPIAEVSRHAAREKSIRHQPPAGDAELRAALLRGRQSASIPSIQGLLDSISRV